MSVTFTTPQLETERLILRGPRHADLEAWTAFQRSERSRFVRPGEVDEAQAWRSFGHIAGMWALLGYGSFVFTLKGDDTALGMAGPWFPVGWPEPELGWTVWSGAAEGKGYAREAVEAARDFARRELGWQRPVSYIDERNARSIALAERLGCSLDPEASHPEFDAAKVLVYRHPSAEAVA